MITFTCAIFLASHPGPCDETRLVSNTVMETIMRESDKAKARVEALDNKTAHQRLLNDYIEDLEAESMGEYE